MTITQESLNKSSKDLLDQLPDGVGRLVESMAKERGAPLWHCVAGILLEVHTEGRLSAMTIDPSWSEGFKQKELTCEYCKKKFKPERLNQLYCTNRCGEIVEYERKLKNLALPLKPKNKKNVQDMENYLAEIRHRNEIKEIIQILKGEKEKPEDKLLVKKVSHGSDKSATKHIPQPAPNGVVSGWTEPDLDVVA